MVTNIVKNAWVKAFKGIVDDDIDFKDAEEGADKKERQTKEKADLA